MAVADRYALHGTGKVEMSLMTPRPARAASGVLSLDAGVRIAIEAPITPEFRVEEIAITDGRLHASWGDRIYRVLMIWPTLPASGELKYTLTTI